MPSEKPPSPYSKPVSDQQEAENAAYVWLKDILCTTADVLATVAKCPSANDAEKFEWYVDRVRRAFAKLKEASAKA